MSSFFIAGPLIVFLIFVAPLWLLLHYRSKKKAAGGLSEDEFQKLNYYLLHVSTKRIKLYYRT